MSAAHGWLRFRETGRSLSHRLDEDPRPWQADILADHRRWYGPDAPAQVAGAFVLQYLLQVPAQAASATGPSRWTAALPSTRIWNFAAAS